MGARQSAWSESAWSESSFGGTPRPRLSKVDRYAKLLRGVGIHSVGSFQQVCGAGSHARGVWSFPDLSLPQKIGVFHSSSRNEAQLSPHASYIFLAKPFTKESRSTARGDALEPSWHGQIRNNHKAWLKRYGGVLEQKGMKNDDIARILVRPQAAG